MNKPSIELKSIDLAASLSEETPAYTAKLFVDGVHFANVSNHGHGGSDDVHFVGGHTWDDYKALEERVKATYPSTDYDGLVIEESIEGLCHAAAWRSVELRNFRSTLSRKVLIVMDGKVYTLKGKKSQSLIDAAAKHYGDKAVVLNNLPVEEAFNLYTTTA